jgi:hypothetical protein
MLTVGFSRIVLRVMLFTAVLFQSLMFIFLSLHGTAGTTRPPFYELYVGAWHLLGLLTVLLSLRPQAR